MRVILGSLLLLVVTGLMFNKLCFNMVSDKKTQRFLLSLLISGILLKMLVFFSWYGHAGGIEFNPSLADQYAYISDGQSIAEGLESGKFIYYDEMRSRVGYSYFVGIILLIFGRHLFFLSICNIFLRLLHHVIFLI